MEILGGPLFAVAGAGESHGPAVTTIVFGCPPGQYIRRQDVQAFLDRRRPGGNKHGTPRNEKDKVVFLSGLYQDDHEKLLGGSSSPSTSMAIRSRPKATKRATQPANRSRRSCFRHPRSRATTRSSPDRPAKCGRDIPTWSSFTSRPALSMCAAAGDRVIGRRSAT